MNGEKTLIAVVSCALYPDRRAAIRNTWAKRVPADVDLGFFVGMDAPNSYDAIHLLCPDDYLSLPQKTYMLVRYARERGYTRLIKVDDDTYLRLPDALEVLSRAACVAHVRNNPIHNQGVNYPQGGCYSLNYRAMAAISSSPALFTTGLEDAAVGRALFAADIALTDAGTRIKTDWRLGRPFPNNDIVSAHHVSPAVMRDIHTSTFKGDI